MKTLNTVTATTIVFIPILIGTMTQPARADIAWQFQATGGCGERFGGTFITNDSGDLTSSAVTGTGGCLSLSSLGQGNQDGNFTNIGGVTPSSFSLADNPFAPGDDNLFVVFSNPLTPAPFGTVDPLIPDVPVFSGGSYYLDEFGDHIQILSGSATVATPEPASLLVITGAILALMFRRRKRQARSVLTLTMLEH